MRKLFLITALVISTIAASASPLWMRYSAISPDGGKIAFSYKGDIYVVDASGGKAQQLTTTSAYENTPIWSPDGTKLAFASTRNGNFDLYVMSPEGGRAQRVTTNSTDELPLLFSKDSKKIYYSAGIQKPASSSQFTAIWITELYSIPVEGGRSTQILSNPVMNLSLDPDGKSFIYENRKGNENIWRKHHTSSVARDIFKYDATTNTHTQLTTNIGEDRYPIYTPDGKVIFLSERDGGTFNVYKADPKNMESVEAITNFKEHPVRFLSQANDGTICYGFHGEIYTQKPGGQPSKVAIEIANDFPVEEPVLLTTRGSEVKMTSDGNQIFYAFRGDIFATTDDYATINRITDTPETERSITISPDGRTIAYASERNSMWNIYTATIVRDEESNFANATLIDEQPLFKNPKVERFDPQFSPDGKELAFVENRNELKVINLATKKVRTINDGTSQMNNKETAFFYQWSPDGNWIATTASPQVRNSYPNIVILSTKGDKVIHPVTESGYANRRPTWVLNGNAILFASERYGMRSHGSWGTQFDLFIAFMNQESFDKYKMSKENYDLLSKEEKSFNKPVEIDLDNLTKRIVRVTPMSSNLGSAVVSKDGNTLYFLSSFEGNFDLWQTNLRTKATKIVKKGVGSGTLQISKDGKTLYQLGGKTYKMNLANKATTPINLSTTMIYDAAKEREYMFDHVIVQEAKRFYNLSLHGVNLDKLREDYKIFLPYINNKYDYAELLSEVLGELNVSHTGGKFKKAPQKTDDSTAELALLYDLKYEGNGLKVDEVLLGGPFDKSSSKLEAGCIIEKINGIEILAGEDYFPLLNKKAGVKTLVSIYNPSTKARWDEVVVPTTKANVKSMMYARWVASRKAATEELSKGRLGYVHIQGMNDPSFRTIYDEIFGQYNLYEGIVIDTRFNGGGRLHEDVELLFTGVKYLEQNVRGELYGEFPSKRYNKESIMITGEANYSNAYGTPWVYQYMKIGRIVGMPIPGTMTAVTWETLQDPELVFGIPQVGLRTVDGKYLENIQLEPDVKVANKSNILEEGRDEQLETAIKELLKEIDTKTRWSAYPL